MNETQFAIFTIGFMCGCGWFWFLLYVLETLNERAQNGKR